MKKTISIFAFIITASYFFFSCCKEKETPQTETTTAACTLSDTARTIKSDTCICVIPNAFTPDGNGLNDVYRPSSFNVSNYSMTIKDGTSVLFTTTTPNTGWDGTNNNNAIMPAGIYTLELTGNLNNGPSINTSMCIYLCAYNNNNCISKPATTSSYLFEDQVDPITGSFIFLTGEVVCP